MAIDYPTEHSTPKRCPGARVSLLVTSARREAHGRTHLAAPSNHTTPPLAVTRPYACPPKTDGWASCPSIRFRFLFSLSLWRGVGGEGRALTSHPHDPCSKRYSTPRAPARRCPAPPAPAARGAAAPAASVWRNTPRSASARHQQLEDARAAPSSSFCSVQRPRRRSAPAPGIPAHPMGTNALHSRNSEPRGESVFIDDLHPTANPDAKAPGILMQARDRAARARRADLSARRTTCARSGCPCG